MTVPVYDGQVAPAYERVMGPGDPPRPLKHAEDPNRHGHALCGARLRHGSSSPAGDRCAVCRDLSRRSWVDR